VSASAKPAKQSTAKFAKTNKKKLVHVAARLASVLRIPSSSAQVKSIIARFQFAQRRRSHEQKFRHCAATH